jgi:hypothetical protein
MGGQPVGATDGRVWSSAMSALLGGCPRHGHCLPGILLGDWRRGLKAAHWPTSMTQPSPSGSATLPCCPTPTSPTPSRQGDGLIGSPATSARPCQRPSALDTMEYVSTSRRAILAKSS